MSDIKSIEREEDENLRRIKEVKIKLPVDRESDRITDRDPLDGEPEPMTTSDWEMCWCGRRFQGACPNGH